MTKFNQYPKWMHHPDHQAPVIKQDEGDGKGLFKPATRQIFAEILPDRQAMNAEDEERLTAHGYLPKNGADRETYERIVLEGKLNGGKFLEYPKWKYSSTELPVIVKDSNEEQALKGKWYDSPVDAFEEYLEESAPPFKQEMAEMYGLLTVRAHEAKIDKRSKAYKDSVKALKAQEG